MSGARPAADVARREARGHERPLRIALVISSLGPGGAERVACALAAAWSREGHDVHVVTVHGRDTDTHRLPPGVRRAALDVAGESRNVLHGLMRATRRVVALRRVLLAFRPDLVVSFLQHTNVVALAATAGTRVPVYVCERTDPRRNAIRLQWRVLRRLLYPRAAGVVVQTERVAAWARGYSPRVHVIPNFVERPQRTADPGAEAGPRRLVAMGRLVPEKGFDLLLEAFRRVCGAHPDWSLVILGEGPERKRLEALVAAHRLEHRVSMPGRVADPLPHLVAAHAFALSSRREGFPNALLEAMACGLPPVAFDCPCGPAEIIVHGQNGLLVEAGDVAQLAAALGRVMGSPAERVRLGRAAREIGVVLAPEQVLGRWSALLREVGAR